MKKCSLVSMLLCVSVSIIALYGCGKEELRETGFNPEPIVGISTESIKEDDAVSAISESTVEDSEKDSKEEENFEESEGEYIVDVSLDPSWKYADFSVINSGVAKLYRAKQNRRDVVIGVNAGHGTKGGDKEKTYCHPDKSPKVTGGSTAQGAIKATAVSSGMTFSDGTPEAEVTLKTAQILRDKLLAEGYDVLMLRDGVDVQLDNIARTVICNNTSACMISLHWDGDGLDYDKGCFYISTPEGLREMEPVSDHWEDHHKLGEALVEGLREQGAKIYQDGTMPVDLTQTSYSCIPSIDVELGNQSSAHDEETLSQLADGLVKGVKKLY